MSDHELEAELQELQKRASETFPEANRVPAEVCVVHERAVWKSAQLQDESSKRSRTDNKRLGTFTMWLMIATGGFSRSPRSRSWLQPSRSRRRRG